MSNIPAPVSVASAKAPTTPAVPAPGKAEEATAAVTGAPEKPAEATEKKERKGRSSALVGKVIYLVEAKIREKMPEGRDYLNPKREGTKGHEAFKLYKNGQKVSEFLALAAETKWKDGDAVGSMADVRWDSDHGFIELKDA